MVKGRTTLILFACVLLLGAFIWVQEVWRTRVPSREIRRIRLFELDPETLVSIQFQFSSNRVVECVKENGVWMTGGTGRGLGRADVALVHKMVAGLNSMGKGTTITPEHLKIRGLDAAEYGFDEPAVEVIAVDNRGWHHWMIGRETPLGDMVYVKQGNQDEIYTVMDRLLDIVPPEPDTLRDRTLFPGNPAGVRRIEIRGSGGFIQLLKDSNSEWKIQQPLSAAADPKAVDDLLDELYRLRIEDFVAENVSDFSIYGLQGETRQISLGGADGSSRMLVIGDAIPDRSDSVYARRADDTAVFELSTNVFDLLEISDGQLRDARMLTFPVEDVSSISIVRDNEQLELALDESGTWRIMTPVMWQADTRAVNDMLELWDTAMITEFDDTNTVSSAEWVLTFGSTELNRTNRVEILPAGSDRSGLRIRRTGNQAVCQINIPFVPEGLLDPLLFKDRRLWELRTEEIQKISIEKAAQSPQVVERQQDGTFAPVDTETTARIDEEALDQLLNRIRSVSAASYVAYNPHDLSIYGLSDPSLILHMGLAGTDQLGRVLLVGQEGTSGFYAMVKGHDVVFLLDKGLVEVLSADLVAEREKPAAIPQ